MRSQSPAWKQERAKEMRKNPSPGEALLWSLLRGKHLGVKVRRQAVVWGYIADFYCPAAKLVIEVDGAHHLTQVEYDARRDGHLRGRGLKVIRFTHKQVMEDTASVMAAIQREVSARCV